MAGCAGPSWIRRAVSRLRGRTPIAARGSRTRALTSRVLFRRPTGLADGLAPKERRYAPGHGTTGRLVSDSPRRTLGPPLPGLSGNSADAGSIVTAAKTPAFLTIMRAGPDGKRSRILRGNSLPTLRCSACAAPTALTPGHSRAPASGYLLATFAGTGWLTALATNAATACASSPWTRSAAIAPLPAARPLLIASSTRL